MPCSNINKQNQTITDYEGKKLMIVSFLEGKAKQNLSPQNCKSIGVEVARMHQITKNIKIKRQNDLSVKSWRSLFETVKDECSKYIKIFQTNRGESEIMLKIIGQKFT